MSSKTPAGTTATQSTVIAPVAARIVGDKATLAAVIAGHQGTKFAVLYANDAPLSTHLRTPALARKNGLLKKFLAPPDAYEVVIDFDSVDEGIDVDDALAISEQVEI